MSSGEVRKVSRQELQLVQNLIERCLQLYMNQREVVNTLLQQAKIEPDFTELVWQKLEEENQEFFRAYHLRLIVKDQILKFNQLLERQAELMHQICPIGIPSISMSNGSQIPSAHQDVSTNLPNACNNDASPLQSCMPVAIDLSTHARRIDAPSNTLLAQNSDVATVQGMNGGVIKSESGYAGSAPFMFGPDRNIVDACPTNGDASVSSYSNAESNAQLLNGTIMDPETYMQLLGQIPRNFSLSDLTADPSNSYDFILESYSKSPFLAADPSNFLETHGRGEHQGQFAP